MDPNTLYLAPLFLVTALIYAMIGQGGASAYLAILALFNLPFEEIPQIALACNIVASLGIAYHFAKAGHLKTKLYLPFIVTSVPAAFLGGILNISEDLFKVILILILIVVSLKLFLFKEDFETSYRPNLKKILIFGPLIGFGLGFIAGMIGIGGGIFLTPVIIFLRWGKPKEAAVAGGLFTLANSISGLIGHSAKGDINFEVLIPLAFVVFVGSQIGAHLGAKKVSSIIVQKIFAALLFVVAVRLAISMFV